MNDKIKAHVTYATGPLKDDKAPLAGESFWADRDDDGTFTVDNVLIGSDLIGYRDTFRAEYDGVWWEVTEVIQTYPCWRGFLIPRHQLAAKHFFRDVTNEFGDDVQMEGWMGVDGPITFQVEPSVWPKFQEMLETHLSVIEYVVSPTSTVNDQGASA